MLNENDFGYLKYRLMCQREKPKYGNHLDFDRWNNSHRIVPELSSFRIQYTHPSTMLNVFIEKFMKAACKPENVEILSNHTHYNGYVTRNIRNDFH